MESSASRLIRDFSLDEFRQEHQRFLPSKITSLGGDDCRHAFLGDVQLCSAGNFFQRDRRLHFAGQVRVVEFVRMTNAFVRCQFDVFSAERVALARAEIRERHFVSAADFGVQVMNLARESVRWKPFDHGVRIEERAINSLRRRPEHSVESDGVCVGRWHDLLCVYWFSLLRRAELAIQDILLRRQKAPPPAPMFCPVTHRAASLARNTAKSMSKCALAARHQCEAAENSARKTKHEAFVCSRGWTAPRLGLFKTR